MMFLASIANATSVCVPRYFQHWACDAEATTFAGALPLLVGSGPHTVHLQGGFVEPDQVVLPDPAQSIRVIGHLDSTSTRATLGPVTLNAGIGVIELEHLDIVVEDSINEALKVDGGKLIANDVGLFKDSASNLNRAMTVISGGSLTATDLRVADWSADVVGGQLYVSGSQVALKGGSFVDGRASAVSDGGAIHVAASGALEIDGTRFERNVAADDGGGIDVRGGTVVIDRALFCGNAAGDSGGAIRLTNNGDITVRRSVFTQNTSDSLGGAIYQGSLSVVDVSHSTFDSNNSLNDDGIHANLGVANILNNLFIEHEKPAVLDWGVAGVLSSNQFYSSVLDAGHANPSITTGIENVVGNPRLPNGRACSFSDFTPPCEAVGPVDGGGVGFVNTGAVQRCNTPDADGDGLMLHEEIARGTDPFAADTDGDGISDLVECGRAQSSSLNNPSFETLLSTVPSNTTILVADNVPGWTTSNDIVVIAGTAPYDGEPVPHGVHGLYVDETPVYQDFEVVAGERLVVRFEAVDLNRTGSDLTVDLLDPVSDLPFYSASVALSGSARHTGAFVVPAGVEVARIRFSSFSTSLVDVVYVGPDVDTDGDGIFNCLDSDSDGDGASDHDEVLAQTDPLMVDSDQDGFVDLSDPDPVRADSDQDGLPNWFEELIGSSPTLADTDADGVDDGVECPFVGARNGGFEFPGAAATQGWGGTGPGLTVHRGLVDAPPPVGGRFIGAIAPQSTISQNIFTDLGVQYTWELSLRGAHQQETVDLEIDGVSQQLLVVHDLGWSHVSGVFVATDSTTTFTLEHLGASGQGVWVDNVAIYPASSIVSGTRRCLDPAIGAFLDGDGDGVQAVDDCDDNDPDVGAMQTVYQDADIDAFGAPGTGTTGCIGPGFVANDGDCADSNGNIYPGAIEICNGVDDNCNFSVDEGLTTTEFFEDSDGDGYGSTPFNSCFLMVPGYVTLAGDCDDTLGTVFPGADEVCNGIDDDCNTTIDDGLVTYTHYLDADLDSFGSMLPTDRLVNCESASPIGYVDNQLDCNDVDAGFNPNANEQCDGLDNNCNNSIDEGLATTTYYLDADGDTFGATAVERCEPAPPAGFAFNSLDCDDNDSSINPDAHELCDSVDHNCDTLFTEGATDQQPYFLDADADGFGAGVASLFCLPPLGYVSNNTDCDDTLQAVNPDADESCNLIDDDCDGEVDNNAIDFTTYYPDTDNDGNGAPGTTVQACTQPPAYSTLHDDCDDSNPNTFPGAIEQCDMLDNDCDTEVDESVVNQDFFRDADGDGFGNPSDVQNDCITPAGYVLNNTDCNDVDPTINPNAVELCDGVDNNCMFGEDDAVDRQVRFLDQDGDGFGEESSLFLTCDQAGVSTAGDCDDTDTNIGPFATEVCDGIDNNCDFIIDLDASDGSLYFRDADGDGFGSGTSVFACSAPIGFGAENSLDCDDSNGTIYPGATEFCDDRDNNCDGLIDDEDPDVTGTHTYFQDSDGDGYGDLGTAIEACEAVPHQVEDNTDCNDSDASVHPGATELCDGVDRNCDGAADAPSGYPDADGDGYGAAGSPLLCGQGVDNDLDCDDGAPDVHPDATEICDNDVDEDCDGQTCQTEGVSPQEPTQLALACETGPSMSGWMMVLALLVRRRYNAA